MSSAAHSYRRGPGVRFRVIDGEAVIMRQRDAEVMVLNQVGTRILELADQGGSAAQIVEVLLAEFEVERDELERDTEEFLAEMVDDGVLVPDDSVVGPEDG